MTRWGRAGLIEQAVREKLRHPGDEGSTVFLDEIGELSLEVQAKLLRVLQEGQFQRLGNPKTIKVNDRVAKPINPAQKGCQIRIGRVDHSHQLRDRT
jgi:transcriptional regulator with PAS, ATPase and Fis domain